MRIWCRKCGWNREVSQQEFRKMVELGRIECSKCEDVRYLMEDLIQFEMENAYFWYEQELQYAIMNALFKRGATVWQCPAEVGLCKDPIMIDNVPFGILVGDFPFYWDGVLRDMELKLVKRHCRIIGGENQWRPHIEPPTVLNSQSEMLLQGGGLLLIVSEPAPSSVGLTNLARNTEAECQTLLEESLRKPLGRSEIPYEIILLDFLLFKTYWIKYFKRATKTYTTRRGMQIPRRKFGIGKAREIIPEAFHSVTMEEFHNGKIVKIILELVENRKRK